MGRLVSLYIASLVPCCGSPGVVIRVITHPLLWVAWCRYMCRHSYLVMGRLVSLYVASLIPCCGSPGVVIFVITHPLLWVAWCRYNFVMCHHSSLVVDRLVSLCTPFLPSFGEVSFGHRQLPTDLQVRFLPSACSRLQGMTSTDGNHQAARSSFGTHAGFLP